MSPKIPLAFGGGLDRETGLFGVQPTSFFDLRNVYLHEGKTIVRNGFTAAGAGEFAEVDLLLNGHGMRGEQLGIVVGWNATEETCYVYRCAPDLSTVELLGEWVNDSSSAWGDNVPRVIMAEVFGRVFMAHDTPLTAQRAPTIYYDGVGTGDALKYLFSTWADGVPGESAGESAESTAAEDRIRFRGVCRHLSYLVGWGFGSAIETRPELLRISLPDDPTTFDPNHYFIVGDRNDPVVGARPVGGDPGVLKVWKRQETYDMTGYDRRSFGMFLADPSHGIIAGRAFAEIGEGTVIAWAEEGPRLWSGRGPSTSIEIPLGLEEWEPTDLVAEGEEAYAFGIFVPKERIAWFQFNRRVYTLTARIPGRFRWSFQELPFDAYGAMVFFEGERAAIAPVGYPAYNLDENESASFTNPTIPGGSFANVAWRNFNQAGDELVEVWYRVQPAGTTSRTVSGLIQRNVALDADDPFLATDWDFFGTDASPAHGVDVGTGRLSCQDTGNGGNNLHGMVNNVMAAEATGMVQATGRRRGGDTGFPTFGVLGAATINDDGTGAGDPDIDAYGYRKGITAIFGQPRNGITYNPTENFDLDTGGAVVAIDEDIDFIMRWEPDAYEGWNSKDDTVDTVANATTEFASGRAGMFGTGTTLGVAQTLFDFSLYNIHDDYLVYGSNLPSGYKLKILGAADAVLATATESGGTAQVDCMDVWLADALAIIITDGSDVEVDRVTPTEGVWGGDVYTYSTPTSTTWILGATVAVSTLFQQSTQITGLTEGETYDVALRYRRGITYNPGAEVTASPDLWPSISRGSFTTILDNPTISGAVWSRTDSVTEGIELTIVPAVGNDDEDINIYRRLNADTDPTLLTTLSAPHADPLTYDDETISGEEIYQYSVTHESVDGESPFSDEERVWSGPADIPVLAYLNEYIAGYTVGFTIDASNDVELEDTYDDAGSVQPFALRATEAGASTADEVVVTSLTGVPIEGIPVSGRMRVKETVDSTEDFGEYSTIFPIAIAGSEEE